MGAFEVVIVVLALVCRATARGYGPGAGSFAGGPSVAFGGVTGPYPISAGSSGRPGFVPGSIGGYGSYGSAAGLPGGGFPGVGDGFGPGIGGGSAYDMAPKPFSYGYESPDGEGGSHFKTEEADGSGAVRGTYGYTDTQGLYRLVEYVADQSGFRATVNTNEPGVDGKEDPADVRMIVGLTPPGIQEQYTFPAGYGAGAGGFGGLGGIGGMGRGIGSIGGYSAGGAGGARGSGSLGTMFTGGYPGVMSGGQPGGYPGSLAGGYPGAVAVGYPGALSVGRQGGFPGALAGGQGANMGGFRQAGLPGSLGGLGGGGYGPGAHSTLPGSFGSGSGAFAGIPRSTSGKSSY